MTSILIQVYTDDNVEQEDLFEAVKTAIEYASERGELQLADGECVFPEVTLVTHK